MNYLPGDTVFILNAITGAIDVPATVVSMPYAKDMFGTNLIAVKYGFVECYMHPKDVTPIIVDGQVSRRARST